MSNYNRAIELREHMEKINKISLRYINEEIQLLKLGIYRGKVNKQ